MRKEATVTLEVRLKYDVSIEEGATHAESIERAYRTARQAFREEFGTAHPEAVITATSGFTIKE